MMERILEFSEKWEKKKKERYYISTSVSKIIHFITLEELKSLNQNGKVPQGIKLYIKAEIISRIKK